MNRCNQNRLQAIEEGKKTYTRPTPCKHCGSCEKYVSSYGCYPCNYKRGVKRLLEGCCDGYMTKEKWDANRERRREDLREINKRYSQTEGGKLRNNVKAAKRRATKRFQTPTLTPDEKEALLTIYEKCAIMTSTTGVPYEVDHITPICKGGLHHPDNVQILTMKENRRKVGK